MRWSRRSWEEYQDLVAYNKKEDKMGGLHVDWASLTREELADFLSKCVVALDLMEIHLEDLKAERSKIRKSVGYLAERALKKALDPIIRYRGPGRKAIREADKRALDEGFRRIDVRERQDRLDSRYFGWMREGWITSKQYESMRGKRLIIRT